MLAESVSVPFTIPHLYGGLGEGSGIATAGRDGLSLEFETKDAVLGMMKSGVRDVTLALGDLVSVKLDKSWTNTKIVVRARSMKALADVPGSEGGEVTLYVARKDRALAERLVSVLTFELSEHALQQADATLNRQNNG